MADRSDAGDWEGRTLIDRKGHMIGKITAVYRDEQTARPEWALVNMGTRRSKFAFVPLGGARSRGAEVIAQVEVARVKGAPKVDCRGQLSEQLEIDLFHHYGLDYVREDPDTATADDNG